MARAKSTKLYRTFTKGLVTEASYLTYPEDTSSDELNTIPTRKGNRTRRYGIDYEDGYQLVSLGINDSDSLTDYVWKSVANVAASNFLCLQVGPKIYFFSLEADPISDSLKAFSINLADYIAPGASLEQLQMYNVEFSAGKGYLFVVHPYVEPIVVEYLPETDSITVTRVIVQIRDFEGLNDNLANDQEPLSLSKEHQYNLMNQGWVQPNTQIVPGGIGVDNLPVYYNPYNGGGTGGGGTPYNRYENVKEL